MARVKGHSVNYPVSTGSDRAYGRGGAYGNNRPRISGPDHSTGLIRFGTDPLHIGYGDKVWPNHLISRPYYPSYFGTRSCYNGYRPSCYPRSCYPNYGVYPWYGYGYGLGFGLGYTYSTAYLSDPYDAAVYTTPRYQPNYAETVYTTTPVGSAPTAYDSVPQGQVELAQPPVPDAQMPNGIDSYQTLTAGENQRAVVMEGNAAFAAGRYDEARRSYARAVMTDARDGYAKMLYAWANFALGDYEVAAAAIRRALLTTSDLVENPLDLRTLYPDRATLDRQSDGLTRFLADHPDHREAQLVWGYLLYSIGQAEPAASMFNGLAGAEPNDTLVPLLRDAAVRNTRVPSPPPDAP